MDDVFTTEDTPPLATSGNFPNRSRLMSSLLLRFSWIGSSSARLAPSWLCYICFFCRSSLNTSSCCGLAGFDDGECRRQVATDLPFLMPSTMPFSWFCGIECRIFQLFALCLFALLSVNRCSICWFKIWAAVSLLLVLQTVAFGRVIVKVSGFSATGYATV